MASMQIDSAADRASTEGQSRAKARMFGVDLDLVDMTHAVSECERLIEGGQPAQQSSLNAAKVVLAAKNPEVREALEHADLLTADGQSVVWAGKLLGVNVPARVAGIDLMEELLGLAEKNAYPVYFLGAREDVLERFCGIVAERYPALSIAGSRNGYFADGSTVARGIRESKARLLFIALPSPAKEFFVEQYRDELGGLLAVGVGGSFDVWAGVTSRAPRWMQRAGLEWFYRLIQEPRKMWRRYLVGNAHFVMLTLAEAAHRAR